MRGHSSAHVLTKRTKEGEIMKNVMFFALFVLGCVTMASHADAATTEQYTEAAQQCSHAKGKAHIDCVREVLGK